METLVIHPKDWTTDFLSAIYSDKDYTVINEDVSPQYLKAQIEQFERIVMLGHGTDYGLIGHGRFMIDSGFASLLQQKDCVCIWCNADKFVESYHLKGFNTGMIISEIIEADLYNINTSDEEVEASNVLLAEAVKEAIESVNMLQEVKDNYDHVTNPVINFNKHNLHFINSKI